ncbi:MAG: ATP-binding protein [Bacteroidales bacterium]|nr:ATP-binding protein [Candidatus Cacconaster merdequi]
MIIERNDYVARLMAARLNGKIKVISGIHQSGKSFLLTNLYKGRLIEEGIPDDSFIEISLERKADIKYRNPHKLYDYVIERTSDTERKFYVFIDGIELARKVKNGSGSISEDQVDEEYMDLMYTTVYDILNDLLDRPNLDIYITASNSRLISENIAVNLSGGITEIKVMPLSFAEYLSTSPNDRKDALEEYIRYGGMPAAVLEPDEEKKRKYLQTLFDDVFLKDVTRRYNLKNNAILNPLLDTLASSVGSLTNPTKLAGRSGVLMEQAPSHSTITRYLDYLEETFLFQGARRWDIRGHQYFDSILKYYATDTGLNNARLQFSQEERAGLLENVIYNELIRRGYSVDVGIVELTRVVSGRRKQSQHEVNFVVNTGKTKLYIQSALSVDTPQEKETVTFALKNTFDFFQRIVVLDGNDEPWYDDEGIMYIGIIPFLLLPMADEALKL